MPETNVTHVDTKTLSGAEGWQVEVAARAAKSRQKAQTDGERSGLAGPKLAEQKEGRQKDPRGWGGRGRSATLQ